MMLEAAIDGFGYAKNSIWGKYRCPFDVNRNFNYSLFNYSNNIQAIFSLAFYDWSIALKDNNMLLLSSNQIQYCNVMGLTADKSEVIEGASYQDKLFTRVKIYAEADQDMAIAHAKKIILESKGCQTIVVKEKDIIGCSWAIWKENKSIKVKQLSDYPINQIDLRILVTQMIRPGGINISDRQYHLKNYDRCFIGKEAVQWFQKELHLSEIDAIRLGQRLLDGRWIRHVLDEHDFKNDYLFYQLHWSDYPVEKINLDQLVDRMLGKKGLSIKDRQYHLKTYPNCFIGEDAVKWFQRSFYLSEKDAIRLGKRLIREAKIHHVSFQHNFKNEYLFYQFYS